MSERQHRRRILLIRRLPSRVTSTARISLEGNWLTLGSGILHLGGAAAGRFVLEVTRTIAAAIGAERTAIRLSPWGMFNDMPNYPEIDATYAYLAEELQKVDVAYLHVIRQLSTSAPGASAKTVHAIRRKFTNTLILNGGYDTVEAIDKLLDSGDADLVAIGRPFVSNPDLVERLKAGLPLAKPNPSTLYAPGPRGFADGYTDYPIAAAR